LHELVEPESVGQTVDRVELTGDEHAFENIVVAESGRLQGVDVIICNLVGVLRQLHTDAEQRVILLVDRQLLDVRGFGRLRRFLAASYRPQEK
jgi:hypothetical protein